MTVKMKTLETRILDLLALANIDWLFIHPRQAIFMCQ